MNEPTPEPSPEPQEEKKRAGPSKKLAGALKRGSTKLLQFFQNKGPLNLSFAPPDLPPAQITETQQQSLIDAWLKQKPRVDDEVIRDQQSKRFICVFLAICAGIAFLVHGGPASRIMSYFIGEPARTQKSQPQPVQSPLPGPDYGRDNGGENHPRSSNKRKSSGMASPPVFFKPKRSRRTRTTLSLKSSGPNLTGAL